VAPFAIVAGLVLAKLVFMGYRNTTGVTPGGSTVPRVIGTLDVAGT